MFSLSNRVEPATALNTIAPASSSFGKSVNSFGQQMATALEGIHSGEAGVGSREPKGRETPGQDSGGSQVIAAVSAQNSQPGTTRAGTGPTAPETTAPGTMEQLFSGYASAGPSAATAAATAPVTEADAYWAEQPVAVQALRNMPDGPAKDQLATRLSNQGYAIDNQIMVMGWDPQTTMMLRQDYGYSWVPSYGGANPFATGVSNPASAPAGSIAVSTAFAVGTIQTPDALLMQSEAAATVG
jgi:hypothetical protein